ncbi:hypothetical protein Sm713_53980 [Streptomyces sp. TS71-3]|nr:hypothetical protein Sm713_53980 [Streptomyces sp. TS71-3]
MWQRSLAAAAPDPVEEPWDESEEPPAEAELPESAVVDDPEEAPSPLDAFDTLDALSALSPPPQAVRRSPALRVATASERGCRRRIKTSQGKVTGHSEASRPRW